MNSLTIILPAMTRFKTISLSFLLALTVALAGASSAQAQIEPYANSPWELNVNSGIQTVEDAGTNYILGTRLTYNAPNGVGLGTNLSWVPVDGESLFLYSGEMDYSFSLSSQSVLFVGAGLGGASAADQTDFHTPLTAGFKWFPGDNPSWSFRTEVRDNVIYGSETTNNWEVSAGFSLHF